MATFLQAYGFQIACAVLACGMEILKLCLQAQDTALDLIIGALLGGAGLGTVKTVASNRAATKK